MILYVWVISLYFKDFEEFLGKILIVVTLVYAFTQEMLVRKC